MPANHCKRSMLGMILFTLGREIIRADRVVGSGRIEEPHREVVYSKVMKPVTSFFNHLRW